MVLKRGIVCMPVVRVVERFDSMMEFASVHEITEKVCIIDKETCGVKMIRANNRATGQLSEPRQSFHGFIIKSVIYLEIIYELTLIVIQAILIVTSKVRVPDY